MKRKKVTYIGEGYGENKGREMEVEKKRPGGKDGELEL